MNNILKLLTIALALNLSACYELFPPEDPNQIYSPGEWYRTKSPPGTSYRCWVYMGGIGDGRFGGAWCELPQCDP
jgi:hypothetical protein